MIRAMQEMRSLILFKQGPHCVLVIRSEAGIMTACDNISFRLCWILSEKVTF